MSGEFIATREFRGLIGHTTVNLVVGQIVRDPVLIDRLRQVKAPIVPREAVGAFLTCPHCHRGFTAAESEESA